MESVGEVVYSLYEFGSKGVQLGKGLQRGCVWAWKSVGDFEEQRQKVVYELFVWWQGER